MDSPPPTQKGHFPQTSWALLSAVCVGGKEASKALEEFSRRYYPPIFAYLVGITQDRDEAEDLAQGFFAKVILSGRLVASFDRAKGSFRPFLKQAIRNYVISEKRWNERKKRAPEEELRPDQWSDGWEGIGKSNIPAPDVAYHTAWVHSLLEQALVRVQALCEEKGQIQHLTLFIERYLSELTDPPSWRELGERFALDEKAARSRAETVARHFRQALREMLTGEVGSQQAVDEEIDTLLRFF